MNPMSPMDTPEPPSGLRVLYSLTLIIALLVVLVSIGAYAYGMVVNGHSEALSIPKVGPVVVILLMAAHFLQSTKDDAQ